MAGLTSIPCVGAIVHDRDRRLLLVRRGHEPGRGRWSVPGGRVEPAESDGAAVVREVAEETGLAVEVVRCVGSVHRAAPGGGTYVIRDFQMRLSRDTQGTPEPLAADDADEARWVTRAELADLPLVEGLLEALTEWAMLPD